MTSLRPPSGTRPSRTAPSPRTPPTRCPPGTCWIPPDLTEETRDRPTDPRREAPPARRLPVGPGALVHQRPHPDPRPGRALARVRDLASRTGRAARGDDVPPRLGRRSRGRAVDRPRPDPPCPHRAR